MRKVSILLGFVLTTFFFSGCVTTQSYYNPQADEKLTVAKAQGEIKIGMSSADVLGIMGSPNIISTDDLRREVWVYDKFSTQVAYSKSSAGIVGLIIGPAAGALGGISDESGSLYKTQRTLTVVIKFDENKKVRDIAYHASSF